MSKLKSILFGAVLFTMPVVATISTETSAQAQIVVYPPDDYIAVNQPEYYEGRPVYYYHNLWYYRDHGRWGYYRSEPGYLRDRRGHWGERVHERERARFRYHR